MKNKMLVGEKFQQRRKMKNLVSIIIMLFQLLNLSCKTNLKESDKIFHAGPPMSGVGSTFFGLYRNNVYEFCEGDFLDPGCYTGKYSLIGDTVILHKLRKSIRFENNKFLVRRYAEMDSSYWKWKYPNSELSWQDMKWSDSARGSEGDVLEISKDGKILFDPNNSLIIRFDSLKNYPAL